VGSGQKAKVFNGILDVTYELRENLFLDLSFQQRFFKIAGAAEQKSTMVTGGVRLNMFKRSYDY
jgi:hypothetical protein